MADSERQKLLERVKRLIALTASDRPEEARTSAYQACRIFRELGFDVIDPLTEDRTGKPSPTPQAAPTWPTAQTRWKPPRTDDLDGFDRVYPIHRNADIWIGNCRFPCMCKTCNLPIGRGQHMHYHRRGVSKGSYHASCKPIS